MHLIVSSSPIHDIGSFFGCLFHAEIYCRTMINTKTLHTNSLNNFALNKPLYNTYTLIIHGQIR